MAGGQLAQPCPAVHDRGGGPKIVDPGAHRCGLEQERDFGVVVGIDRRRGVVQQIDRLREVLSAAECEPENHGGVGRCGGVRRGFDRPPQVLGPAGKPGVGLGHSEVEQQSRTVVGRRRFGERSAQEDRLRLVRTLLSGRARCLDEPAEDPCVAAGLGDEQVLGDALARSCLLGEQVGGTTVRVRALRAGELDVDAVTDDRVHEGQWQARVEDPRARQQLGRAGGFRLVELREARRAMEVALLEDRERACQPARVVRQSTQSELNRPCDRPCADPLHVARSLRGRCDPSFSERTHELAQQERHPSRRREACVHEGRLRSTVERGLHEPGDRRSRQWSGADDLGGRRRRQSREQLRIGTDVAETGRDHERDVQLLETREQEGQKAQGRCVRPVRVVDGHAQRVAAGEVRGQPVEAVQDGERWIDR